MIVGQVGVHTRLSASSSQSMRAIRIYGGVCPGQSLVVGAKLWCDVELGVTRTVFTKSVMVWF